MKKRTKGILAFLLASALMLTTAVGCGGKGNDGSNAGGDKAADGYGDGTGTITMWGWNAGDIEKIFAAYKDKTGADVDLDYVTVQQAEAFQKLQTTVSAGLDLPDIVPSEVGQRGTFLDLGIWDVLTDDPYNFDTSMIFDYYIPLISNAEGKVVCLPWDISTAALAYKKPLAEKYLGTSDPAALQEMLPTWDAFVSKGKEVQSASNGSVFMFASLTNIYQIGYGQNPDPVIEDGKLNMDPINATLDLVATFRDNKTADNIVESSPAYSASYADDLHIFYPCASWSPNYQIAPNDPEGIDRWGLMLPPQGCFSWGGSGFLIPTEAKNKLAGFNFVNWLLTKEGTISQYETVGYFICNKEAYEGDSDLVNMKVKQFGDQNLAEILFVEAMPKIKVRPVTKYDVTINDVWTLVVEAMNSDASIDASAAADMFKTEVGNKAPDLA